MALMKETERREEDEEQVEEEENERRRRGNSGKEEIIGKGTALKCRQGGDEGYTEQECGIRNRKCEMCRRRKRRDGSTRGWNNGNGEVGIDKRNTGRGM